MLTFVDGVARLPLGVTDLASPIELQSGQVIEGQGPGSVLRVINSTAGIIYKGDVSNIALRNFRIAGDGVGKRASGIRNITGANARDFFLENLWLEDLIVGVSLNAYEGGSFRRATVNNVNVARIGGTVAGSGYGIHIAKAYGVTVNGGSADRCGRHSLYCAASDGPSGLRVNGFRITNHRKDENDASYRCAVSVARISDAYIDVIVEDSYDGGIEIAAINNAPDGVGECRNITIRGKFTGRKNTNAYIRLGEELPGAGERITTNVNISAMFEDDGEEQKNPAIYIMQSRNLNIHGCSFGYKNYGNTGVMRRVIGLGDKRFQRGPGDLDVINISGNTAYFDGVGGPSRFIEQYGPLGRANIGPNSHNCAEDLFDAR